MYSLSQMLTAYFRGLIFSLMQFPLLSLAQQPICIWLSADIHLMLNILTVLEYLWTTPCGCLTSVWLSSQTRLLSLTGSLLQLVAPCPICHSRYNLPLPPTLTFHQSSVPTIPPQTLFHHFSLQPRLFIRITWGTLGKFSNHWPCHGLVLRKPDPKGLIAVLISALRVWKHNGYTCVHVLQIPTGF